MKVLKYYHLLKKPPPIAKHLSMTLVCQIYTQVQFVSQSLLSRELQGSALILVACYWKQDLH